MKFPCSTPEYLVANSDAGHHSGRLPLASSSQHVAAVAAPLPQVFRGDDKEGEPTECGKSL